MILNLKSNIEERNNTKAKSYTLGISTDSTFIDQKRNIIKVLAGFKTIVKVIPQVVGTTSDFDNMDYMTRNCKLSYEVANFSLIQQYTTKGCEFECAAKKAVELCKCLPWFYSSNITGIPICTMFQAHCFDHVMSDESNYKKCPDVCLETCKDLPMTMAITYLPIDPVEMCGKDGLFHDHLTQATRQHYVFENYKALVEGRIPEFKNGLKNGSYCHDFVKNYLAEISVGSSTSSVTKSVRSPRATFIDQLGIIGGNLGLFTGMSIFSIFEVVLFMFKLALSVCGGLTLKSIGEKFTIIAFEAFNKTKSSKQDQNQSSPSKINEALHKKINNLEEEIRMMKLLLMTLLPKDKQFALQQNMSLKSSSVEATYDMQASRNTESDGINHHHYKKNVSLTKYFEYFTLLFLCHYKID